MIKREALYTWDSGAVAIYNPHQTVDNGATLEDLINQSVEDGLSVYQASILHDPENLLELR